MSPSWLHGILVGWTSVPDAWTDLSNANNNALAPPATAPTDAKSYNTHIVNGQLCNEFKKKIKNS